MFLTISGQGFSSAPPRNRVNLYKLKIVLIHSLNNNDVIYGPKLTYLLHIFKYKVIVFSKKCTKYKRFFRQSVTKYIVRIGIC
jgi:hypothetical protein